MSLGDLWNKITKPLRPPHFKAGPLSTPMKYMMTCPSCRGPCRMVIPTGFSEPFVTITCQCPNKGESIGVYDED